MKTMSAVSSDIISTILSDTAFSKLLINKKKKQRKRYNNFEGHLSTVTIDTPAKWSILFNFKLCFGF